VSGRASSSSEDAGLWLGVADAPRAWARAGFTVDGDSTAIGGVGIRLHRSTGRRGIVGWSLGEVDGLPTIDDHGDIPAVGPHANGVVRLDHIVVLTPDCDRTTAALESNSRSMQAVFALLRRLDIAERDVQTSGFSVAPLYRRDKLSSDANRITGYRVANQVRVRIRDLQRTGTVLDALVKAGSNQVASVSFDIEDPTPALNEARTQAIADARARAELYAGAAGVRVGRVLSISEQSVKLPQPRHVARMATMEAAVPIAAGETEVRASINVVFALEQAP